MRAALLGALLAVIGGIGAASAAGPSSAADWQAGGGPAWDALLAQARKEGKVVIMGRPDLAKPYSEAFQRDTGVAVDYLGGEGREQMSRLTRELRAGTVTIDIVFGGATSLTMAKQGQLTAIRPQFLLPGVTDPAVWQDGKLKWVDKAQTYLFEGGEYIHGWPVFDSDQIPAGAITRWADLLKPEYKGKISAFDPRTGGPGQAVASFLADRFGIDYVRHLYLDQQVVLANHSRQILEWAARGTYPIALAALPTDVEALRRGGVRNLTVGTMQDGPGFKLGGSAVIVEPKGAPHPGAAGVFLNWFASKPGQEVFASVWQVPSRRTDVPPDGIPEYVIPKPGIAYLDEYDEDWYETARPKVQQAIMEALGGP